MFNKFEFIQSGTYFLIHNCPDIHMKKGALYYVWISLGDYKTGFQYRWVCFAWDLQYVWKERFKELTVATLNIKGLNK